MELLTCVGVCGYGTRVLIPPLHSDPPPFPRSSHQPCACFHPWAFADPFLRAAVWGEKKPNHYGAGTSPPKDPLKKQFCKENLAAPLKWLLGAAPLQTHLPPPPPKKKLQVFLQLEIWGGDGARLRGHILPIPSSFPGAAKGLGLGFWVRGGYLMQKPWVGGMELLPFVPKG